MRKPVRALGLVSLVGAGPGDPELITLKGLKRLQEAQAIVHDRLIAKELFAHCHPEASLIDVGKDPEGRSTSQEDINALLVRLGSSGMRVVRLKGGDPFLFGRGGEEALALEEAGVPWEIVPGVSSALAAPSAAGIPITHRGIASSVTISSGRGEGGADVTQEDLAAYAAMPGTLVFLMGVERLSRITLGLVTAGRSADQPAALVRCGTRSNQVVLRAPLGEIAARAKATGLKPPATLVVGDVATLADELGGPRFGIASTPASGIDAALDDGLQAYWTRLTRREREVLPLAAEGMPTRTIAAALSLSPKTVEHHRASAMKKLALKGQTALVRYMLRSGLIDDGSENKPHLAPALTRQS